MTFYALQPHLNAPEASSEQVPEAGSGQALQWGGRKMKNEAGALATSIISEPNDFSIAEFGFIQPKVPFRRFCCSGVFAACLLNRLANKLAYRG